ncbi:MAG: 16S rRNA (cytosine(967)-C(5))-methyltransferase RsmB [Thomasclavelia sp.]|nr:16S rRNA (cytosine(967)-C(5))-methyltransferase RsmB [Thomasclavelia sp.]
MARKTALKVLTKYSNDNSYINITLNDVLNNSDLSREDKDLCTNIVYGTLQNKLYLEYQLEPYTKDKKVKQRIYWILMISIYQIIFLDKVPTYAIIDEANNLGQDKGERSFINAILRNFTKHDLRSLDDLDQYQKLSITTSHPLWLVKMLSKQYSFEITEKVCKEDNTTPSRSARVNTLKTSLEKILEDKNITKASIGDNAVHFKSGNIASTNYYKDGLVTIQDEASQLVSELLNPNENDYVLDMCCAPGSKTTHLSALMHNNGTIEAYDLFEHKIKLVELNAKRLNATNVNFHVGDSTKLKDTYKKETFDKILLDAPCSGLGVLKRKPEIRYHDSSIMDTIIPLQANLLENAYYLLKNNGKMVYSTCTINKKENEKMIFAFIKKHPDMKIVEEKVLLNYEYHTDGFYMCKLAKGNNDETNI